jgi:hypothetical protein
MTPFVYSLIGNGLLLAALAASNWAWSVKADGLEQKLETASTQKQTVDGNLTTEKLQHNVTRVSLDMVEKELLVCLGAKAGMHAGNDAAARAAAAELANTQAKLQETSSKLKLAMRDPACGVCLNAPVCRMLVE